MKATTYVIKYTNSSGKATEKYRFKHDFTWKTDPLFTLTDGVAITFSPYFTYTANTEYFRYTYDRYWTNYVDTKNVTKTTADKKAVSTGIGFKYDILGSDSNYTVKNNRGTMYFDAQLANTNCLLDTWGIWLGKSSKETDENLITFLEYHNKLCRDGT